MITLQHGTAQANSAFISTEGIHPRKDVGNWDRDYQMPSIEGYVYLTNHNVSAMFHSTRTALKRGSKPSIVTVTVDEENLYPDENLFAWKAIYNMHDMALMQQAVPANKDKWEESLKKINIVAHKGPIDKKNVLDIQNIELEESPFYSFVKNYKEKNLDNFERSFHSYTYHANSIIDKKPKYMDAVEMFRSLEFTMVGESKIFIHAFENEFVFNINEVRPINS